MKKILITGGAGFIGINAASYFLKKDWQVLILDNFYRKGSQKNIKWLKNDFPSSDLKVINGDVRDEKLIEKKIKGMDVILHLAAQVAVTTSVEDPREDFEINTLGSFNVLEAVRKNKKDPILIYSSTNKVYGGMEDVAIKETTNRYQYKNLPYGISESRNLDFHSPYGCSKGSADQYFRDYARIYNLNTVVMRQSCIYGPHQFGVEDQGWLAWFSIASLLDKPITIFGDGKQARDVLFIDDLVESYWLTIKNIKRTKGQVYNIGGGSKNQLSLLELIKILEKSLNKKINYKFSDWRPGDQPIFISDIKKAKREFGWYPKTSPREGVRKLINWIKNNKDLF